MITHRDEQILESVNTEFVGRLEEGQTYEKQFASTNLHLCLHGSAPLEDLATSDDKGEVMSA